MCNIIINTFYINDKILSNNYSYDIKRKLQLTTNRCGNSYNTISQRSKYLKIFCSFKVGFNDAIYDASNDTSDFVILGSLT